MQLKASIDYGLRAVLYLADKGTVCSSKDIAKDMSIPRDYLIQLAQLLRNAGIIEARPGKYGGYYLAKDPGEISVLDVLDALEGTTKRNADSKHEERMAKVENEEVKRAYGLIEESFDAYLSSLTIEVLLEGSKEGADSKQFLADRLAEESERLAGDSVGGFVLGADSPAED